MSQQNIEPVMPFMVDVNADNLAAVMNMLQNAGQTVSAPAQVIMTPPAAELAQQVEPYVEPQPTGKRITKVGAAIDRIADKVKLFDDAVRESNELTARIKLLREEIIAEMKAAGGSRANSATVRGVEVFTFNPKGSYRTGDLQKDYPDLAQTYIRATTVEKFDMDAFKADHPGIAERYQTLEFRRAGGIQGLR